MTKPSVNDEAGLHEDLQDSVEASAYLNAALQDGHQDVFLMALRDVANAHGLARLASESALNRENIYRILSKKGNPRLSSLRGLLDALGLKLSVEPKRAGA